MSDLPTRRFHGPKAWLAAALVGLLAGLAVGALAPAPAAHAGAAHALSVPLYLIAPFAALLLAIALMPFINAHWWHDHYPDVAFFLGALVAGVCLGGYGADGRHALVHALIEYYQFIALVFGLYAVSGAVVVNVESRGKPLVNTILLAVGAVIANLIGTTGASMLLIRPFLRINAGRVRPYHVVFFIFIVSNCGGCLTPIGDPPLYLGFLRGVPFFWTLTHLWQEWAFVNIALLAIFFAFDSIVGRSAGKALPTISVTPAGPVTELTRRSGFPFSISGRLGLVGLLIVVGAVFLDPFLHARFGYSGLPLGPIVQVCVGLACRRLADRSLYERNHFTWAPVKEVACLFVGIFVTMVPALAYLAQHGGDLPLRTPGQYYFATGVLSAALDNAPTYLTFLQLGFAKLNLTLDAPTLKHFADNVYIAFEGTPKELEVHGAVYLAAVSLGAVFFGAMTYIGNGPNFMVKSIAESAGVKMPSFLGYLKYSVPILGPVLALVWALFIRGG